MIRDAQFSPDGTKRYTLWRDWSDEPSDFVLKTSATFVMLNPSKADAHTDDPTVRKCIGFAKRWGHSRLTIVNLFATISTDPSQLPHRTGVDPWNATFMGSAIQGANIVVAAWGSQPLALCKKIGMWEAVHAFWKLAPPVVHCIGLTRAGYPMHPSRAAYTVRPDVLVRPFYV